MSQQQECIEQIRQLKQALEEMEKRIKAGGVPLAVLEDFKSAVDHIRTTVWAVVSAGEKDQYELANHITRFRVKRATQMCLRIVSDIDVHELSVESPELVQFHAAAKQTIERINRLYQAGF